MTLTKDEENTIREEIASLERFLEAKKASIKSRADRTTMENVYKAVLNAGAPKEGHKLDEDEIQDLIETMGKAKAYLRSEGCFVDE